MEGTMADGEHDFDEAVRTICGRDPRYDRQAYFFVREALDFTVKMLKKPESGQARHVTGQELLEGIRRYALQEFGPMAITVLRGWGIRRTEDIGEIVFNLVDAGRLGKTKDDSREDFAGGYDFEEAFVRPFLPPSRRETTVDVRPRGNKKHSRRKGTPDVES